MEANMKKTFLATVLAAVVMVASVLPASAINREWSAVLGFLGGWMVANGGLCPRTVYQEPVYVERPIYRETIVVEEPVVTGHYEFRERQVWEPGFWERIVTRCGREERVWHEGHYRTEMIKFWVDDCRPTHGRHHRR
jgi:hypothetical protein